MSIETKRVERSPTKEGSGGQSLFNAITALVLISCFVGLPLYGMIRHWVETKVDRAKADAAASAAGAERSVISESAKRTLMAADDMPVLKMSDGGFLIPLKSGEFMRDSQGCLYVTEYVEGRMRLLQLQDEQYNLVCGASNTPQP